MKQLNDKLDNISELITRIDAKVLDINSKLDELIKALHAYDEGLEMFDDEPQIGACSKHDEASWDEERMDIIGQNGNEGIHYTTNKEADEDTFSDYGQRIAKEVMSDENNIRVGKDKSNNSDKHTGEDKKRNKRYYKPKQVKNK